MLTALLVRRKNTYWRTENKTTEMLCPPRTSDLGLLLIAVFFLVDFVDSDNSCTDENRNIRNNSSPLAEEMGSRKVLCCPDVLLTNILLTTWKITLRGQTLCTKSYDKEENQTSDNCTDERITWTSRPDLSPDLQINGAAVTHDGTYICEMVNSTGNFQHEYQLQVLVRPEANIFPIKNKTVVCEAVAGKPAAQISWIPQGHCQSEEETTSYSNSTVTVRSSCSYSGNVSTVTCLVSHLTGNWSLSESLPSVIGISRPSESYIRYIIPSIAIILIIVGSVWFLKTKGFSLFYFYRQCKFKNPAPTPAVDEDEMQPYACYTEKNNPLYDTVNKVKMFQISQGEIDYKGLCTL
ncbi:cell surface glycoprotein CD200 receptor 1-like isoform X3 [Cavia porcellus]|uniref:cell surface glycoprotein CD200 receptor 1-like isoform X3 n=1 Tax=Cavia porcellus TaxID=10141 RepID=UPI002FE27F35